MKPILCLILATLLCGGISQAQRQPPPQQPNRGGRRVAPANQRTNRPRPSNKNQDVGPIFTRNVENCLRFGSDNVAYNKCVLQQVKSIQPYLAQGIPSLQIPPLDPLVLANINMKRSEPPVTIDAVFSNVRVTGIRDLDVKFIDIDLHGSPRGIRMGLGLPSLLLRGQYTINGNIFLLPIEGAGNFISKLDTVIVEGSADIVPTGQGVKTTTQNVNVAFKIKNMVTKMDNLFEGNQVLSDTIHHFLNENGQVVLEEVRPELTKTLNNLVSRLFTAIFQAAPASLHEVAQATNQNTPQRRG